MQTDTQDRAATLAALDEFLDEINRDYYLDFERTIQRTREVQASAEQIGDADRLGQALNLEAWALHDSGRLDQSTEVALRLVDLAQHHHLLLLEGRAISAIASNFLFTRDYTNARQLLDRQREIAETVGDSNLRCLALNNLADVFLNLGAPERSIALVQDALTPLPPPDKQGVIYGIAYVTLAEAYIEIGQPEAAFAPLEAAIEFFTRRKASNYVSDCYNARALLYAAQGQFDLATACIAQAREIVEQTGAPRYIAFNLRAKGTLFLQQNRYAEALTAYTGALKLCQEHEINDLQVTICQALIQTCRKTGDLDAALRYQDLRQQTIETASYQNLEQRLAILKTIYSVERSRQETALHQLQTPASDPIEPSPATVMEPAQPSDEQAIVEKNAMLTRLQHEFRTPLTIIRSGADLLGRFHSRMTEEQRQHHLVSITDRVHWMTTMLDDIMLLLALSRGEREACPQPVKLDQVIERALNQVAYVVGETARVEQDIPADIPDIILDPDLLQSILVHLIGNALKFSSGAVHLTARASKQLHLTVTDSGIGIPADELARVREMFYRASNLDEIQGNGLGLALVDQAVAASGGTWQLRSQINAGTTVEITLPLMPAG